VVDLFVDWRDHRVTPFGLHVQIPGVPVTMREGRLRREKQAKGGL